MHSLKKLLRDLWLTRWRTLAMVVAIGVGLAGFNAVLGAYSVLTRELGQAYRETQPASATLELDSVSEQLLQSVRARPEVAEAVRRRTVHARFRKDGGASYDRALIFVIDDFGDLPVAKLGRERGAWPPPPGTVLLERSALPVIGGDVGDGFWLKTPRGRPQRVTISGVVHEPALAPANTEQAIYAYVTEETLIGLGAEPGFDEIRVLVSGATGDRDHIENVARRLSTWIESQQLARVRGIQVPPPLTHPHQTQMTAVLVLLLIFSAVVLVLSSVLAASLIATLMARQVREIAIMKTVGARAAGILRDYVLAIEVIAVAAVALAWPLGRLGAEACARAVAQLLNFDLASVEQPGWVVMVQLGVGLCVPLLVALPSIWRSSRTTVREALADYGVSGDGFGKGRLDAWLARVGGERTALVFALRNVVRRRRRFLLAFALLSAAGGAFIGARSAAQTWDGMTQSLYASRHYDLEVRFDGPERMAPLVERLARLPGVGAVEAWGAVPTVPAQAGRFPVGTTYPDASHGSQTLLAPPVDSTLFDVNVRQGRRLESDDRGRVVINQVFPGAARIEIGDELPLMVAGHQQRLVVVGKIEEVGMAATAYVNPETLRDMLSKGTALSDRSQSQSQLRIAAAPGYGGEDLPRLAQDVDRVLTQSGAGVQSIVPLAVFENAVAAHFDLLVRALLALAVLTGIVGALGLSTSMSANIIERTRELGVLRAIGARSGQVLRVVVLEGVCVGLLSVLGAIALGASLALAVSEVIGQMSFRLSLPLTFSVTALVLWTMAVVVLAVVATAIPARAALRMTVRRALDCL